MLKVYDKTFQQRQAGNLKVESNLIRVELVFLDRMLDRMYSSKKSLEDILTRKAIETLIDQYKETFDEICEKNITPMLKACAQDVFETLTQSDSGNEISNTLIKCKELIVDIEVLRRALKNGISLRQCQIVQSEWYHTTAIMQSLIFPLMCLKRLNLCTTHWVKIELKWVHKLLPCDPKLEKLKIS